MGDYMNFKIVSLFLGRISLAETGVLLVPLFLGLWDGDGSAPVFVISIVCCFAAAAFFLSGGEARRQKLTAQEGIAITGLGWILATALGMVPYVAGDYLGFLDGIFESISGFTGTGATVISDLTGLPQSILLWRSMTHWLGGLGIVVIFIALLPESGQNSSYIYNAEAAGPTKERVLPRLQDMTKVLFEIYSTFTLLAFSVFLLCGMDFISALNHALSTVSAGGFSTYNESAAYFDNVAIEGWMTFFMILAGGNFGLYYRVYHKGFSVLRSNTEFKAYMLILLTATVLVLLNLMYVHGLGFFDAARYAAFQVVSIETTGFVSADYDQWPAFSKIILLGLMLCGGCAGSTAAGLKVSRVVILIRSVKANILHLLYPKHVLEIHMNGYMLHENTLLRAGQYFFVYILFIALWALLLAWDGIEIFDAVGISVSTTGCVGPAFGITGATCTYAELSTFAKTVLCFSMLIGRLEIFTFLAMLRPGLWRGKNTW